MHSSPPETRASLILRLQDVADVVAWDEFAGIYSPVIYRVAVGRGFQAARRSGSCPRSHAFGRSIRGPVVGKN